MVKLSSDTHSEPHVELSHELFHRLSTVASSELRMPLSEELQEQIRQLVMAAYLEGRRSVSGRYTLDQLVAGITPATVMKRPIRAVVQSSWTIAGDSSLSSR